jgi:hypothetical protein
MVKTMNEAAAPGPTVTQPEARPGGCAPDNEPSARRTPNQQSGTITGQPWTHRHGTGIGLFESAVLRPYLTKSSTIPPPASDSPPLLGEPTGEGEDEAYPDSPVAEFENRRFSMNSFASGGPDENASPPKPDGTAGEEEDKKEEKKKAEGEGEVTEEVTDEPEANDLSPEEKAELENQKILQEAKRKQEKAAANARLVEIKAHNLGIDEKRKGKLVELREERRKEREEKARKEAEAKLKPKGRRLGMEEAYGEEKLFGV